MQNIVDDFINAMNAAGISPSNTDIRADNKLHGFHISGDPKSKKRGYYRLRIDGDFGYGYFGDWRDGDYHAWHTKCPQKYTPEEKKAFAERRKRIEAEEKAAQEATWKEKAQEARDFCLFLDGATDHPYLRAKGIKPHGALISSFDLILPMTNGEAIQNYQKITPEGEKRFLTEARKQGFWYTIEGDDTICLVEGFSTGASVHEATGHTVICAMDAGNLVAVAPAIKAKYPTNKIIICADNDHGKTDRQGRPRNTGIAKGKEAADILQCAMIYPEFREDERHLTDFNDLHAAYGLDAVLNRIRASIARPADGGVPLDPVHDDVQPAVCDPAPPEQKKQSKNTPQKPPKNDAWRGALIYTKKGGLEPHSTTNVLLMMEYADELEGVFRYDSFSKRILVVKQPPWEDVTAFEVRPVNDFDYVRLEGFLELKYGLKCGKNKCADVIYSTACLPANEFNPARDYFESIPDTWDRVPRLDTWLKDFASDGSQPSEYLALVGRKFVCGLAARAMNAGIKFDTMLIFEGKQYAGKSFLSRLLGTIEGREYFLDDFKDIENKDSLMKMQGKLVIEFPEISTMRRAEVNDLKGFLSRQVDVFRPPYGHNTLESPRQCVFVGTVNPEGPYLRDVTDNRRYWPVACRDKLDLSHFAKIIPQLHAEAAYRVKAGEPIYLTTDEEYDLCKIEQSKRQAYDVWEDKISECVGVKDFVTMSDILLSLNISIDKATPMIHTRITQTMVALGYTPERLAIGGMRKRGFKRKGALTQETLDYTSDAGNEEDIPW
jgi:putative DNA primase/helicase